MAATVIEALGDDRYLVQLEGSGAGESPDLTALLDQMDAGQADAGGSPVDPTEPFDVPGGAARPPRPFRPRGAGIPTGIVDTPETV